MNIHEMIEKALENARRPVEEKKAENVQIISDMKVKAARWASDSIGKPFAIKVSKNEVYRGTITACDWKVVVNGLRAEAHFRVTINNLPARWVTRLPA